MTCARRYSVRTAAMECSVEAVDTQDSGLSIQYSAMLNTSSILSTPSTPRARYSVDRHEVDTQCRLLNITQSMLSQFSVGAQLSVDSQHSRLHRFSAQRRLMSRAPSAGNSFSADVKLRVELPMLTRQRASLPSLTDDVAEADSLKLRQAFCHRRIIQFRDRLLAHVAWAMASHRR